MHLGAYSRWPLPVADGKRLRLAIVRSFTAPGGTDQAANALAEDIFGLSDVTPIRLMSVAVSFLQGQAVGDSYLLTTSVSLLDGWASATPVLSVTTSLIDGVAIQYVPIGDVIYFSGTASCAEISAAIAEALNMTGTTSFVDLPNLIDSLTTTGSAASYATLRNSLSDSAAFSDVLGVAWALTIQQNLTLAGAITEYPLLLGALADALVASGVAASQLDAVVAITAALTIEDFIANGWSATAVGSIEFSAALTNNAALLGAAIEAATITGAAACTAQITALVDESVDAGATLTSLAAMSAAASDQVLLYGSFRLGADEYAGWVLNTESKGASQYTNYPFDSLAMLGSVGYGAGDGGIYKLAGDDDAGTAIAAYVRTGLMDFATGKQKHVPDVYVGFRGDGRLVLKTVTTTATGTKVEDWYISPVDTRGGEIREGRFELGRGVESRYWGFELHNKAGGDLELSEIALRPVILSRRR